MSALSVDLNYLEEGAGSADLTVAVMPKSDKIVLLQVTRCNNPPSFYNIVH